MQKKKTVWIMITFILTNASTFSKCSCCFSFVSMYFCSICITDAKFWNWKEKQQQNILANMIGWKIIKKYYALNIQIKFCVVFKHKIFITMNKWFANYGWIGLFIDGSLFFRECWMFCICLGPTASHLAG